MTSNRKQLLLLVLVLALIVLVGVFFRPDDTSGAPAGTTQSDGPTRAPGIPPTVDEHGLFVVAAAE